MMLARIGELPEKGKPRLVFRRIDIPTLRAGDLVVVRLAKLGLWLFLSRILEIVNQRIKCFIKTASDESSRLALAMVIFYLLKFVRNSIYRRSRKSTLDSEVRLPWKNASRMYRFNRRGNLRPQIYTARWYQILRPSVSNFFFYITLSKLVFKLSGNFLQFQFYEISFFYEKV